MSEHITIEIPTKFYGDILKNKKAYYLKIENNQVTEVLSCTELENITRKSSKSELSNEIDDRPILYSCSTREEIDRLNERIDRTKQRINDLLERACSGVIRGR